MRRKTLCLILCVAIAVILLPVAALATEEGSKATGGNNVFTDVQSGVYYYDAVLWAVEKGITKGTSASAFSPNANCTRGQIVTFLYRDLEK